MHEIRTVRWIDAHNYGGWWDSDTVFRPVIVETTGYVVKEDDVAIVLALAKGDNDSFSNVAVIPKVCVLEPESK